MAKYRIHLRLNSLPAINQTINIGPNNEFHFKFVSVRQGPNEVTIAPNGITATVHNLLQAFNIDYNYSNEYYTSNAGSILIISRFNIQHFDDNSTADITIDNIVEDDPVELIDIVYSEASVDTCNKVKATVNMNMPIKYLIEPYYQVFSSLVSSFELILSRGTNVEIIAGNSNSMYNGIIHTPDKTNDVVSYSQYDTTNNTASIIILYPPNYTLQFSLDGINYSASNIFTDLVNGQYTLYIKDQYDCITEKQIYVTIAGSYNLNIEPFVYISKGNSLIYALRKQYDCSNFKTSESSLSCETDKLSKHTEIQYYQSCDKITTQVKTSYENIICKIKNLHTGIETNIPFIKITENFHNKQSMDAEAVTLVNGNTGIYFEHGNIYNFNSGAVEGTYNLSGKLPEWAFIGGFVIINAIQYSIINIIYDEYRQVNMIEILGNTNVGLIIAKSVWNKDIYEVYENEIDLSNFNDTDIQVSIKFTDTVYPDVNYISEIINIKDKQNGYYIESWNKENNDIYNGKNIHSILRIEGEMKPGLRNKILSEYNDGNVKNINANNNEIDIIRFKGVTDEMYRKLLILLSNTYVFINGQLYADAKFELKNNFGSNINFLTVTLTKSTNNMQLSYDTDTNVFNIPAILNYGEDTNLLNIN